MKNLLFFIGLAFMACPTVLAGESPWTLRFHGVVVQSSSQAQTSTVNGVVSRVDVGTSGGFGLGAEYRFSDRVGLEFSVMLAALEMDHRMSANGASAVEGLELSMVPLTLGVPFHFSAGSKTDLYVGPTLSHVSYVNITSSVSPGLVGTAVDVGSDTTLGAAFGLDRKFGSGAWAFSTGLRYMKADAGETEVDPLIVTLGFAYRFGSRE